MPKFSSQVDLLKIPVKNFAVEGSPNPPGDPVIGQQWCDTSLVDTYTATDRGGSPGDNAIMKYWDGDEWVRMDGGGTIPDQMIIPSMLADGFCLDIRQGGTGYHGDNYLYGLKQYLGIASAANKYAEDLTKLEHGVPYVVEHNLGTTDVTYSLREITTGNLVANFVTDGFQVRVTGANTLVVTDNRLGNWDELSDVRIVVIG